MRKWQSIRWVKTYNYRLFTSFPFRWIQRNLFQRKILAGQPVFGWQFTSEAIRLGKDITMEVTICFPRYLIHDWNYCWRCQLEDSKNTLLATLTYYATRNMPSVIHLFTSPSITRSARFGKRQAPLVCSPEWRIPGNCYFLNRNRYKKNIYVAEYLVTILSFISYASKEASKGRPERSRR